MFLVQDLFDVFPGGSMFSALLDGPRSWRFFNVLSSARGDFVRLWGSVSEHAERMREPYLHYQSEAAPVGRETSSRSLICICEALFFRAAWQSFAGRLKRDAIDPHLS